MATPTFWRAGAFPITHGLRYPMMKNKWFQAPHKNFASKGCSKLVTEQSYRRKKLHNIQHMAHDDPNHCLLFNEFIYQLLKATTYNNTWKQSKIWVSEPSKQHCNKQFSSPTNIRLTYLRQKPITLVSYR